MIELSIPLPLRRYCNGNELVTLDAKTVDAALGQLIAHHPAVEPFLLDNGGALRPFVNIFVEGEDIRMRDGLQTAIGAGQKLEILPAIAGGSNEQEGFRASTSGLSVVTPTELVNMSPTPVIVDVRTAEEWGEGHLPDATHIDRGFLELRIAQAVPDIDQLVVCYCQSGVRSKLAVETLVRMGFRHVANLDGGVERWKAENRPVEVPPRLSDDDARRYQRHLTIPEIGLGGQAKLAASRVAIIGMGGLGCPVSTYLAAAGVGTLGLVDSDLVDITNLQRQFLYTPDMVGRSKAQSAEAQLARFNPSLSFEAIKAQVDEANIREIIRDFDLVIDCTDNFTARYLINDEAVAQGKPLVHGAVYRFDAQISVFGYESGPCYRCFLPEPPPPDLAPSCADAGVLGVLPGVAGLLMANEALKVLAGFGTPLSGRMLCFEAKSGTFREVRFPRNSVCPVCAREVEAEVAA